MEEYMERLVANDIINNLISIVYNQTKNTPMYTPSNVPRIGKYL
mgnify:FL=1